MNQNRRDSPSGFNFYQVAHVGPSPLSGSSSSHGTAHHPLRENYNVRLTSYLWRTHRDGDSSIIDIHVSFGLPGPEGGDRGSRRERRSSFIINTTNEQKTIHNNIKTTNERKEQWVSERRAYVLLYLYYQAVHSRTIISYLISISFRPGTEFV